MEGERFRVRCLCLQKYSPSVIVEGLKRIRGSEDCDTAVVDEEELQEWFVDVCFGSLENASVGDVMYWKRLLQRVMKQGDGCADVLAETLIDLGSLGELEETESWLNKVYLYGDVEEMRIRSHVNMFEGSTGCFEWDAGYLLAEYVMNRSEEFRGRMCVELGCGCGMVGVALSRMGGCGPVVLTDGDEDTLENCRFNLKENGVLVRDSVVQCGDESTMEREVVLKKFQWEDGWYAFEQCVDDVLFSRDCNGKKLRAPVSLIGADLLYDPEIIPVIVPMIAEFLRRMNEVGGHVEEESSVYLSTTKRSEKTLALFLQVVEDHEELVMEDCSRDAFDLSDNAVHFLHIPSLDQARKNESIILHKITYASGL